MKKTIPNLVQKNIRYFLTFVLVLWLLRLFEFTQIDLVGEPSPKLSYLLSGMAIDILIALILFGFSLLAQFVLQVLKVTKQFIFPFLMVIFLTINLGTIIYFKESKVPLDESLFFFSIQELVVITNGISGIPLATYILGVVLIVVAILLVRLFARVNISVKGSSIIGMVAFLSLFFVKITEYESPKKVGNTFVNNRAAFFLWKSYGYFKTKSNSINEFYSPSDFKGLNSNFFAAKPSVDEFPLYHPLPEKEKFGTYFHKSKNGPPNIVLIIVEGLNSDFIGDFANSTGNCMPFLDSLRKESLYFPHFLSTCQRTYNVLPAILASVPNSTNGEYTMMNKYTPQLALTNLLKRHYFSRFYCGADLRFTNMNKYMEAIQTDYLVEKWEEKFKMPFNDYECMWGFPDGYLFEKSLLDWKKQRKVKKPRLDIMLTVSTHGPFAFPGQDKIELDTKKRIKQNPISKKVYNQLYKEKFMMSSYTYTDLELRNYFEKFSQNPEFENTIFIITGDHGTPYYSRNVLSNYHVPLVIFSPLLKSPKTFQAISSHVDIAPTLVNFLRNEYEIPVPKEVSFIGKGLNLSNNFSNQRIFSFLSVNGKNEAVLHGEKLYINGEMYKVGKDFIPRKIVNQKQLNLCKKELTLYEKMSRYVFNQEHIVPPIAYSNALGEDRYKVLFSKIYPKLSQLGSEMYLPLLPPVKIPLNAFRVKISVEMDAKMTTKKDLESFPSLVCLASTLSQSKKLLFWENSTIQLYGKFKPNGYNRVAYHFEVDLRKYPNLTQNHEFTGYIYNVQQKNLDIRKINVLILAGN